MWDVMCIVWYPTLNMMGCTEFSDTWYHDMWHVVNHDIIYSIYNICLEVRIYDVWCVRDVYNLKHETWWWELWRTTWYMRRIWQYVQYIFVRFMLVDVWWNWWTCQYSWYILHTYIHTYIHTLHYITLHYLTLPYLTLHYITLHYITYSTYSTYVHTYVRTYIHTYLRTYVHTYIRTYVRV